MPDQWITDARARCDALGKAEAIPIKRPGWALPLRQAAIAFNRHARTDLPRALDLIDQLTAENVRLQQALRYIVDTWGDNDLLGETDTMDMIDHVRQELGL